MSMEPRASTASPLRLEFHRLTQVLVGVILATVSLTPYPSATQYAPEAPRITVADLDLNQPRRNDPQSQHRYRFSDFELRTAFGGINTSSYHYIKMAA